MTSDNRKEIEDERLVDAIVHLLMREGEDEISDEFLGFMFWEITRRGHLTCSRCGLSLKGHAIRFFEDGKAEHAFNES